MSSIKQTTGNMIDDLEQFKLLLFYVVSVTGLINILSLLNFFCPTMNMERRFFKETYKC